MTDTDPIAAEPTILRAARRCKAPFATLMHGPDDPEAKALCEQWNLGYVQDLAIAYIAAHEEADRLRAEQDADRADKERLRRDRDRMIEACIDYYPGVHRTDIDGTTAGAPWRWAVNQRAGHAASHAEAVAAVREAIGLEVDHA